jgi:hypothetical protein
VLDAPGWHASNPVKIGTAESRQEAADLINNCWRNAQTQPTPRYSAVDVCIRDNATGLWYRFDVENNRYARELEQTGNGSYLIP